MAATLKTIVQRARRLGSWFGDRWPFRVLRPVFDVYSEAGGGLLGKGLAYDAVMALLPGLLLVVGLVGLVVQDPTRREDFISSLARQMPPLHDLIRSLVEGMGSGAAPFSLVGTIGLLWGASRFYASLDAAFARIFGSGAGRGFVDSTVRGIAAVGLLVATVALDLVGSALLPFGGGTTDRTGGGIPGAGTIVQLSIGWAFTFAGLALVYRLVPRHRVPWGHIVPVAAVVSILLTVFSDTYGFLAPRLIGSAALYGAFVAFFGALVWLAWCCQAVLLGAAALQQRD